jgi:hypothetical protein
MLLSRLSIVRGVVMKASIRQDVLACSTLAARASCLDATRQRGELGEPRSRTPDHLQIWLWMYRGLNEQSRRRG